MVDNHRWFAKPDAIISKTKHKKPSGCPECKRRDILCHQKKKWTNEKIDEKLLKDKRTIKRLGIYGGYKDIQIEWECLVDGYKWYTSPGNVLNGKSGCPICKFKNEKRIYETIKTYLKYDYIKPHKSFYFNNRRYTPDFYIEIHNRKIIIEYNGQQHYYAVEFFGGDKQFEKQKKRDEELRVYCKQNDITLLEISFSMSNEDVIKELITLNNI